MAKNKTTETTVNVTDFLNEIPDEKRRSDGFLLLEIMQSQTQMEAKMWGPSIIGFGRYHYKYASGHEGDMPLVAFSPRKESIVLYPGLDPAKKDSLLQKLGKHKASKGCIYIKKLSEVNLDVMKEIIDESVRFGRLLDVSIS